MSENFFLKKNEKQQRPVGDLFNLELKKNQPKKEIRKSQEKQYLKINDQQKNVDQRIVFSQKEDTSSLFEIKAKAPPESNQIFGNASLKKNLQKNIFNKIEKGENSKEQFEFKDLNLKIKGQQKMQLREEKKQIESVNIEQKNLESQKKNSNQKDNNETKIIQSKKEKNEEKLITSIVQDQIQIKKQIENKKAKIQGLFKQQVKKQQIIVKKQTDQRSSMIPIQKSIQRIIFQPQQTQNVSQIKNKQIIHKRKPFVQDEKVQQKLQTISSKKQQIILIQINDKNKVQTKNVQKQKTNQINEIIIKKSQQIKIQMKFFEEQIQESNDEFFQNRPIDQDIMIQVDKIKNFPSLEQINKSDDIMIKLNKKKEKITVKKLMIRNQKNNTGQIYLKENKLKQLSLTLHTLNIKLSLLQGKFKYTAKYKQSNKNQEERQKITEAISQAKAGLDLHQEQKKKQLQQIQRLEFKYHYYNSQLSINQKQTINRLNFLKNRYFQFQKKYKQKQLKQELIQTMQQSKGFLKPLKQTDEEKKNNKKLQSLINKSNDQLNQQSNKKIINSKEQQQVKQKELVKVQNRQQILKQQSIIQYSQQKNLSEIGINTNFLSIQDYKDKKQNLVQQKNQQNKQIILEQNFSTKQQKLNQKPPYIHSNNHIHQHEKGSCFYGQSKDFFYAKKIQALYSSNKISKADFYRLSQQQQIIKRIERCISLNFLTVIQAKDIDISFYRKTVIQAFISMKERHKKKIFSGQIPQLQAIKHIEQRIKFMALKDISLSDSMLKKNINQILLEHQKKQIFKLKEMLDQQTKTNALIQKRNVELQLKHIQLEKQIQLTQKQIESYVRQINEQKQREIKIQKQKQLIVKQQHDQFKKKFNHQNILALQQKLKQLKLNHTNVLLKKKKIEMQLINRTNQFNRLQQTKQIYYGDLTSYLKTHRKQQQKHNNLKEELVKLERKRVQLKTSRTNFLSVSQVDNYNSSIRYEWH